MSGQACTDALVGMNDDEGRASKCQNTAVGFQFDKICFTITTPRWLFI